MNDTSVLWEETVEGGASWSHILKRGAATRLTSGLVLYSGTCVPGALVNAGQGLVTLWQEV